VAAIAAFIALRLGARGAAPGSLMDVLRTLYLWLAIATILGHGHRYLNRPWPWLRWANESVYPWYVLHQTLIVVGVTVLTPFALGPVLEPMLLVALTILGCWLLTDGLIRRFNGLRPLFGLKLRRAEKKQQQPASAGSPPPEPGWRSPSPRA
jgi:hypothetical protein